MRMASRARNSGVRYRPTQSMSFPGLRAATRVIAKNTMVKIGSAGPWPWIKGATPTS